MWRRQVVVVCAAVALVGSMWTGDIGVIEPQSVSAQSATCLGDFNGDGKVNLADFLAFAGGFGARSGDANFNARLDLDGNGAIDLSDFLAFAGVFGTNCEDRPRGSVSGDRAALVAFYNATDGPNWVDNTNWLTDAPVGEWYGVYTDASGRVARLILPGRWDYDKDQLAQGLRGELPPQLGDLSNLTELDLSWNALSGPIPTWLGNLPNLRLLNLYINNLKGPIPPELGNLANLQRLDLGHNFDLSSPIPPELGKLANLEYLYLGRLNLTGTIPPELGNLTKLKSLGLNHCGGPLGGSIPPELGNLTSLTSLSLQYTNLTGTIPPELGNLANLEYLHLEGNNFTGPIPPELGNLTGLRDLSLGQNQLTGPIPPELGNLTGLTSLWLPANDLSGPLPASMLQLEQLGWLSLTGTKQGLAGNDRLCVPGTPAFAAWLEGIDRRRSSTNEDRGGTMSGPKTSATPPMPSRSVRCTTPPVALAGPDPTAGWTMTTSANGTGSPSIPPAG